MRILGNEQRPCGVAQVHAIEAAVDTERGAKFSWTIAECEGRGSVAILTHHFQPHLGFHGAYQHRLRAACWPADGVDAKMKSVNEINVGMSGRSVHGAIAFRFAAESVRSRIIRRVSLHLDNRSAARTVRRVANQPMAQQTPSHRRRRRLVE
jgi:hypothetical protein